ncbi:MAG: hypothetical protein QOC87_407 [Actinomycetota bacterium]|nr:hypothetical protein [Actinomycetota bacterium]
MSAGALAGSLLQAVLVAALGWIVVDVAVARLFPNARLGNVERGLLSIVGFVAFAVLLMVINIVTGGLVFGVAGIVPVAGAALLVLGYFRRAWPRGIRWKVVLPFVIAVSSIYIAPVIVAGSGVRTGDSAWHLGWTQQLLHGEPVPTGPAPTYDRNAYPWGFHAVLATMVRLVPGSDPVVAHDALGYLLVFLIPLGAAALARLASSLAGWPAAVAVSLIGGFGWIAAHHPSFITSPGDARFGADLVVASPNSVYELLPPAFPRELGLVLLVGAALLIAIAVSDPRRIARVCAGVVVGLVGLVSVPMLVSAMLWTITASFLAGRGRRLLTACSIIGVALVVFALWAGPVVASYLRYGGFVNITPQLGMEWSLPTAVASWGLLVPLAVAGAVLVVRNKMRSIGAFALASAALLGVSLAREAFGWQLAGNATLLHQGRAWPPFHLVGAALAGIAAAAIWAARPRLRRMLAAVGAVVMIVGAASPVYASVALTRILQRHAAGFVYARDDLGPGSFVRRVAAQLDPSEIARVQGDDSLGFFLFEFSGCRLASYDDPRLQGNDLRIRDRDLAAAWNAKIADGGFSADALIVPAGTPVDARWRDHAYIATGTFEGREWTAYIPPVIHVLKGQ